MRDAVKRRARSERGVETLLHFRFTAAASDKVRVKDERKRSAEEKRIRLKVKVTEIYGATKVTF